MPAFTIDTENSITAHAEQHSTTDGCHSITTEKELAKLTTDWPGARLAEIWNSFAGVAPLDDLKPVKLFTDRASTIVRIWKAVQRMNAGLAPPSAPVAPRAKRATQAGVHHQEARRRPTGRGSDKKAGVRELMPCSQVAILVEIMHQALRPLPTLGAALVPA